MSAASRKLQIAFASSEVAPFSKTGGLADVLGSLPKALGRLGHHSIIVTPYYRQTRKLHLDIKFFPRKIFVQMGDRIVDGQIATAKLTDNVDIFFIVKDEYFDRDDIYRGAEGDFKDNAERFIFFSKSVLSALEELDIKPDILHCHDWQTGLIPALLKTIESSNPFFIKTKFFFTIHNMAFQGQFWHYDMHMTNLPWEAFTPEGIEYYGKINLLKAGINYADTITTVSHKYADEIKTKDFGCGLEGVLQKRSRDLYGILNGVDYDDWNPEKDFHTAAKYFINDLSGKLECKRSLLKGCALPEDLTVPLFGIISRLTEQKGIELLKEVLNEKFFEESILVVLGEGDQLYEEFFQSLSKKFPKRIFVKIGYDVPLSHQIEAGADFFLMPSRFEPCGLNQIYSLKYGTVPIVHATGGLDDTITEFSPAALKGNGFKFSEYTSQAMNISITKALEIFHQPSIHHELMKNGMKCNFSWDGSAKKYEQLYLNDVQLPPT